MPQTIHTKSPRTPQEVNKNQSRMPLMHSNSDTLNSKSIPRFDVTNVSSKESSDNNSRETAESFNRNPRSSLSVESSTAVSSSSSPNITPSNSNKGRSKHPTSMGKTIESLHTFATYDIDPYSTPISSGSVSSLRDLEANSKSNLSSNNDNLDPGDIIQSEQISINSSLAGGFRSIHGSTKKIADLQSSGRKRNWNILPGKDHSCLLRTPKYNILHIEIDGQIKPLKYVPEYNHRLSLLDMFYSFNKETKSSDSLNFSKERLKATARIMIAALKAIPDSAKKENDSDSQSNNDNNSVLNSLSQHSVVSEYSNEFDDGIFGNRSQVDLLIHFWFLQLQKFLLQKNSLFYSNEALQCVLQRKALSRKTLKQHRRRLSQREKLPVGSESMLYLQPVDDTRENAKISPIIVESIDEIDILVIRPPLAYTTGLQLAYDEPSVNVADFELNSISWYSDTFSIDNLKEKTETINSDSSKVKIISRESELEYLSDKNAKEYIVDCMWRQFNENLTDNDDESIGNMSDSSSVSEGTSDLFRVLPQLGKEDSSNSSLKYFNSPSNTEASINSVKDEAVPQKKKSSGKKSSIVNFFRRKYHPQPPKASDTKPSSSSGKQVSSSNVASAIGSYPGSSTRSSVRNYAPSVSRSFQSSRYSTQPDPSLHQTIWLENYFGNLLNNYKKVNMPTQYYLPKDCGSPVSLNKSVSDPDFTSDSDENIKAGTSYNQQFLQLKLPFQDNSIPAIYCPWVWGILPRKRWHVLAKELFRILENEGYALAVQADIIPTNTNPIQSTYKTALEKEKIFDSVSINAINQNLFIHPTKHLSNLFREHGFTNIKASTLSLKLGDLTTDMGCLNEFASLMVLNFVFRYELDSRQKENKNPGEILENYLKEHWGEIDNEAGAFRMTYIVAQKPKKILNI